ncbi:hypothetical protein [Spirosoma sp.]|uniref:hypothetical protein n=1 Tax=Spirosoma sp. TaxID=1899569 RepID=UPI003B3A6D97
MKKLALFLLIALSGCSPNRATLTVQPNRILYSSSDMNETSTADSIAQIKPGNFVFAKNLRLRLQNGERKTIAKKAIWGYSDEKGKVWRRFRNSYYQIMEVSDVVEYEKIEPRNVGPGMVIYEPVKMYSKTLDSKIVGSRRRALRSDDAAKTQ